MNGRFAAEEMELVDVEAMAPEAHPPIGFRERARCPL
jgi:hypothetical protein